MIHFVSRLFLPLIVLSAAALAAEPRVTFQRVPDGGLQPQAMVDGSGTVHLIYFKGDAAHGDLFYVRSSDGCRSFTAPLRVNTHAGSAIAIGTVRGAHLALGKNNRVHVAWMGSDQSQPKAGPTGKASPMLYTRLDDAGTAFEPERNVISEKIGLDGGGSLAADAAGNVLVAWHAPAKPKAGEENRAVWIARSADEGKTFAPEVPAWSEPTGACGCCGMRIFIDAGGATYILYRSATDSVNRDMYALVSPKPGAPFSGHKLTHWEIAECPMSTASFAGSNTGALAVWENEKQIYIALLGRNGEMSESLAMPGKAGDRKHPSLAIDAAGITLVAWAQGTGWQKGGSVVYQLLDSKLKPVSGATGSQRGLPAWSMPAAVSTAAGFVILY